jgi:rod shape-determining protein MreD
MNFYITAILLTSVAIIQTAVTPGLMMFGLRFDLMLVVVVYWGLLRGVKEGLIWGAFGGMALDLLSGSPFGVFTVSLIIVSLLTSLGETTIFRANILLPIMMIVVATVVYHLVVLAMLQFMGWPVTWSFDLARLIAPAVVLNLICLAILYRPLRWLHQRTGYKELPLG